MERVCMHVWNEGMCMKIIRSIFFIINFCLIVCMCVCVRVCVCVYTVQSLVLFVEEQKFCYIYSVSYTHLTLPTTAEV